MARLTRRGALLSAALVSSIPLSLNSTKAGAQEKLTPMPLVHVTDLFRPHNDPDDHWDLATAFALAWRGNVDLLGILTDNPENIEELPDVVTLLDTIDGYKHVNRSPDVAAVSQLNYITDKAVPVATGTIWPGRPGETVRGDNLPKELRGVHMLLDVLRRSRQPVAIFVGGSCQDVAIAGKKEPELFSDKCAAIYLNAGAGSQNPAEQTVDGNVEWNVSLNRGAYATVFELRCPIYWMPCVHGLSKTGVIPGEYASIWSFQQKEILPYLSSRLQAFFAYMLTKESGTNWLSYLLDSRSKNSAQKFLNDERAMWGTAGFLHLAGKTVTLEGKIVSLDAAKETAAYEFVPIEVCCNLNGITEWHMATAQTRRFIFRVKDTNRYPDAMARALKSVLLELP